MSRHYDRRRWMTLTATALLAASVLPRTLPAAHSEKDPKEPDVPAAEDLMREHGVLRRALLVYSEAASRLSLGKGDVPVPELGRTAALFRTFGEDYHERALEEQHVFPPLIRAGGAHAALARTLIAQHQRGRQVTDYVSAVAKRGTIAPAQAPAFVRTLTLFVRMYQHHAAIEDTVIFSAWKRAISPAQYRELTEQFEELEQRMFGADGFEDAVGRIAAIEGAFGLQDLAALTPPPPPS